MNKSLHKILFFLIVLIVFPIVLVVFYEYSNLNESEQLINAAYKNQLESLVSSVNTYTQDIATNWASRIEAAFHINRVGEVDPMDRLMSENQSIKDIYTIQLDNEAFRSYSSREKELPPTLNDFYIRQQSEIQQLLNYYKSNYRKIAAYGAGDQSSWFYFIVSGKNEKYYVCFVRIDNAKFFQNQLRPRIQSIAQLNFTIDLTDSKSGELLLSNEKEPNRNKPYDLTGAMWLFPETTLNIRLKNETINQLVHQRLYEGLLLFGALMLVILVGVWFLYTNIRNQIRLAQIKSEFISNVSHEIRTPLALISMYIETLEMGRVKTAEKVKEYYQIITKETQRLAGMVDKILNFSKLESGKRTLKFDICQLNEITQKVLNTYAFHLSNQGFSSTFIAADNLPHISCDADAVADALINLIENAVKYSTDKKQIEISTGKSKKYVFVEVKDFGMGISKKHQKLIFDKFYRVSNENLANKVKGTGLGLALVNETMKRHKGKIVLSSKLHEGSTFRLLFPLNSIKKP